jgi:uncharacterized protein YcfJ
MNRSLIIGSVLGAAAATVGGVFAGYTLLQKDQPEVHVAVAADPECVPEEPRDKHRIAGTVAGAVVGGAVGEDLGDRDITTAAGAAAGALAGNRIQKEIQENRAGGCAETGRSR